MNQPPGKLCLLEPGVNRPAPGKLNDLRKRFEQVAQQNLPDSRLPQEFGLSFGSGGTGGGGGAAGGSARPSSLVVVNSASHSAISSSSGRNHAGGQPPGAASRAPPTSTVAAAATTTDAAAEPLDACERRQSAGAAAAVTVGQPRAASGSGASSSRTSAAARRSVFAAEAKAEVVGSSSSGTLEEAPSELPKPAASLKQPDSCSDRAGGCVGTGLEPQAMLRHGAVVHRTAEGSAGAQQPACQAPLQQPLPPFGSDATTAAGRGQWVGDGCSSNTAGDGGGGGSGSDRAAASVAVELPPSGTVASTSRLFERKPAGGRSPVVAVFGSQAKDGQSNSSSSGSNSSAGLVAARRDAAGSGRPVGASQSTAFQPASSAASKSASATIIKPLPATPSKPMPATAAAPSAAPAVATAPGGNSDALLRTSMTTVAAAAAAAAAVQPAAKLPVVENGERARSPAAIPTPTAIPTKGTKQEPTLIEGGAKNNMAATKQPVQSRTRPQGTLPDEQVHIAAAAVVGDGKRLPAAAGEVSVVTDLQAIGNLQQPPRLSAPEISPNGPATAHQERTNDATSHATTAAAVAPAHLPGAQSSPPTQSDAEAARPPKPPRTFEHDIYVLTKLSDPTTAARVGGRTAAARPKSIADFGRSSLVDDEGDSNASEAVYDDVVFAVGPSPDDHWRRTAEADDSRLPPPLPQRPTSHLAVPSQHAFGGAAGRALSEGDDVPTVVGSHTAAKNDVPGGDSSGLSRGGLVSAAGNGIRPNGKKAAAPRNLREMLFAKSKATGPPPAAGGLKKYASEECLSTAGKADKGGGRDLRTGSRWPTIDEGGYAVPEVNGKTTDDDWPRDRRKGARSSAAVAASNGLYRVGSHGDVSRAGLAGEGLLSSKNAAQLDLAKIHVKLNSAFSLLGEDRRTYHSTLDEDTSLEDGQDAGDSDEVQNGIQARKKLGQVKEQSRDKSANDDEGTAVPDQEVLQKWLKHCISVKQYSIYASANKVRELAGKAYPQLYQYALIVSLRKHAETNQYEPYVLFKFPPHVDLETTGVPQFCFPDAQGWQRVTEYRSETFTFVLTEGTGIRQYGYCRRLLPPSKGNVPRIPEVVCLVSPLSAFKFYLQVLDEIERRRKIATAEEFLQAAYGKPLPRPGETVAIRAMMDVALIPWKNRYGMQDDNHDETEIVTFSRAEDARIDGISYEQLLRTLTSKQIITCFGAILLERKIVFCAEKLSTLSSCVNALVSLVYPFAWQHTFVPVLPPSMIEVACSPTPFIIGLLSSNLDRLLPLEMDQVLIVNLDTQKFIVSVGDEAEILPKQLQKALCLALDLAKSDSKWRDTFVAETFLRFFFETVGNLSEFFTELDDGERIFEKERLISSACDGNRTFLMGFLEWFTQTQMFDVYITERLSDPQPKQTAYDEKFMEWLKEFFSSEQAPVQRSFFKNFISRARIKK